jgi:hypothetical protein
MKKFHEISFCQLCIDFTQKCFSERKNTRFVDPDIFFSGLLMFIWPAIYDVDDPTKLQSVRNVGQWN